MCEEKTSGIQFKQCLNNTYLIRNSPNLDNSWFVYRSKHALFYFHFAREKLIKINWYTTIANNTIFFSRFYHVISINIIIVSRTTHWLWDINNVSFKLKKTNIPFMNVSLSTYKRKFIHRNNSRFNCFMLLI